MSAARERWELEDPERVLHDIDQLCPLVAGRVVVASLTLVGHQVLAATTVAVATAGLPSRDGLQFHDALRDVACALVPDRARMDDGRFEPMTHLLVTVVCREGRVIDTAAEHRWLYGWRYANHFTRALDGDVYVVTPHGWTGVMDQRAGHLPRLRPRLALVETSDREAG